MIKHDKRKCQWVRVMQNLYNKNLDLRCATMAAYIFKLQVTNFSFDRRTFCTSLSSVEIHFQSNRYFTTFIVFSTSMLFIYLCTTFIKRIIHNLICSDALCMRNNVQCTFYIMFCQFMQFNKIFKTIFEYIRKKFRFVHTHTFCEYRKNYAHRLACILFQDVIIMCLSQGNSCSNMHTVPPCTTRPPPPTHIRHSGIT